jgi:hypothetical protein
MTQVQRKTCVYKYLTKQTLRKCEFENVHDTTVNSQKSAFEVKTTFHEKLKFKNIHHTITIVNIHGCLDILTEGPVWRYQDSS